MRYYLYIPAISSNAVFCVTQRRIDIYARLTPNARMSIHLIKLSVGSESPAGLERWQKQRMKDKGEIVHITRMTPKRAEELLKGGSIYWVIKGFVCARNELLELRPMTYDGTPHCGLVYKTPLIRVRPIPRRAFQGWRYLSAKDAPADIGTREKDIPEKMLRELSELGLL